MLTGAFAAAVFAAQQRVVAAHKTPSSVVAVVRDGRIVYDRAVGVRNVQTGAPATPQTIYRIGSVSKLFTAVAVMQLVQARKLSLDERLSRFYPAFPNAGTITVREMLMHRSGIPNYLDAVVASGEDRAPTTPGQIIARVARMKPVAAPGTAFAYSNTNYVLLGRIVERVSGMPLHAYERAHIFLPAGMHATYADRAPAGSAVATGYALPSTLPQHMNLTWAYGCGDLLSTAGDLARFDIALMNGTLLKPQTFAQMTAAAMPAGSGYSYGLGITVAPFGSSQIAGHHGGVPGFEADDEMLAAKRFAVVSLGNDFRYPTSPAVTAALVAEDPSDTRAALAAAQNAMRAQTTANAATTARFDAFFRQLLKGSVDPAQVTATMRDALTPQAVASLDGTFAPLGTFSNLQFAGEDDAGGYHRYHYTALFAEGSKRLMFVLDANGKIAGLFQDQ